MSTAGLAERLMHLVPRMREESLASLEDFVLAAEEERGGILCIAAPSKRKGRDLPEAGYRSEVFADVFGTVVASV